jgi:hypothetical protein
MEIAREFTLTGVQRMATRFHTNYVRSQAKTLTEQFDLFKHPNPEVTAKFLEFCGTPDQIDQIPIPRLCRWICSGITRDCFEAFFGILLGFLKRRGEVASVVFAGLDWSKVKLENLRQLQETGNFQWEFAGDGMIVGRIITELSEKNDRIRDLEAQGQEKDGFIQRINTEKDQFTTQIRDLKAQGQEKDRFIQRINAEKAQLTDRIGDLEAQEKKKDGIIQRINAEKDKLTTRIRKLEAQGQEKDGMIQGINAEKDQLTARIGDLEAQEKKKDETIRQSNDQNGQLQVWLGEAIADRQFLRLRQLNSIRNPDDFKAMEGKIGQKIDELLQASQGASDAARRDIAIKLKGFLDGEVGAVGFDGDNSSDPPLPRRAPQQRLRKWTVAVSDPGRLLAWGYYVKERCWWFRKGDHEFQVWDTPCPE